MSLLNSLLGFLDSRSFTSIWYWILLLGMWSATGRNILGIPSEVIARARTALKARDDTDAPPSPAVMHLLDWLSLTLPRWQLGPREGTVFLGIAGFGLSSLGLLGFVYGLEMAQALTLLLFPFLLLFWMRIALARRLTPLMLAAEQGEGTLAEIAVAASRRLVWHQRLVTLMSVLSVALAALWGAVWVTLHPFGL